MIVYSATLPPFPVLGSIVNEIHNVTISEGERANFTCQFVTHGNDDIIVFWTVGTEKFDCGASNEGVAPGTNGCHGDNEESVLMIESTSIFGLGDHPVVCNLDQNLSPEFISDPSFEPGFNNITTKRTVLTIESAGILCYYVTLLVSLTKCQASLCVHI